MKKCTGCGEVKALGLFSLRKDGKHLPRCRACQVVSARNSTLANPEKAAKRVAEWVAKNIERRREIAREWARKNKAYVLATTTKRRAGRIHATPQWADAQAIKAIYQKAEQLRALGLDVHVDHIFPLRGKQVCGLHVHNNLQILLASDNRSKSNKIMEAA